MTSEQPVTEQRRAAVTRLFSALSARRVDEARSLMTPSALWWMLSKRMDVPIEAWLAGYDNQIGGLFPQGLRFELDDWTIDGPRVAVQARATGRRADDREYANAYHFLIEFDDLLITRVWEYGDTLHAEQVMRG